MINKITEISPIKVLTGDKCNIVDLFYNNWGSYYLGYYKESKALLLNIEKEAFAICHINNTIETPSFDNVKNLKSDIFDFDGMVKDAKELGAKSIIVAQACTAEQMESYDFKSDFVFSVKNAISHQPGLRSNHYLDYVVIVDKTKGMVISPKNFERYSFGG